MGDRASRLAVTAAAVSIVRSANIRPGAMPHWEQATATRALFEASRALEEAGRALGLGGRDKPGLRTTLIALLATPAAVGYAYIGDGGGMLLRSSGEVERFLKPQKGESINVLTASLGPEMDGGPVSGTLTRQDGDLLIVGTDGVFDRTPDSFPKDLMRGALDGFDGDLQALCDCVLDQLAQEADKEGPIFDDNMTLGIVGAGHPPVLQHGFWLGSESEDAGHGHCAQNAAASSSREDFDAH
jgi:serine/threonine protein phosphatase PrpC